MKKLDGDLRCIHCLESLFVKPLLGQEKLTRDHVFPKSWYPDNTPDHIQYLTAPACLKCNKKLGSLEKQIFIKLAGCIDPQKVEASGINKKLLKTLGIDVDKPLTPEEMAVRQMHRKKLLSEMTPYTPDSKPFPGLGLHDGFQPELHMTIPVPIKELVEVSKKIIKGLEYNLGERYIEPPFEVEIYFPVDEKNLSSIYQMLAQHGTKESHGPGFKIERVESTDGSRLVIYRVTVWGTLVIYGSIMPPEIHE